MDPTDPKSPPEPPHPPEPDEREPEDYDPEEVEEWPADPKTEEAKTALMEFFAKDPPQVYYQRQLEVIFERDFFHWVTVRALRELVEEDRIQTERLGPGTPGLETMCFYWPIRLRYYTRQMHSLASFVETELLQENFHRALGRQAEMLFDAGLATAGFTTAGKNVKEWNGVRWTRTAHDLDRVYTRDGIFYGAEIKNRLAYIEREEMETKMEMSAALEA